MAAVCSEIFGWLFILQGLNETKRYEQMPTILITGANRGIGYALAESYVKDGWRVLAACRSADALVPEGAEACVLDVADPASLTRLKEALADTPIDILWNNAGVYLDKGQSLQDISDEDWLRSFQINTVAPIRIADALAANVAASERKVMVFTTSIMASLTGNGVGAYAYRSSKTALNMAVRCLSKDLSEQKISCLMQHPGHVRTDMGGKEGAIDTATSVAGMRGVVDQVNPSNQSEFNGQYFNYDGSPISW